MSAPQRRTLFLLQVLSVLAVISVALPIPLVSAYFGAGSNGGSAGSPSGGGGGCGGGYSQGSYRSYSQGSYNNRNNPGNPNAGGYNYSQGSYRTNGGGYSQGSYSGGGGCGGGYSQGSYSGNGTGNAPSGGGGTPQPPKENVFTKIADGVKNVVKQTYESIKKVAEGVVKKNDTSFTDLPSLSPTGPTKTPTGGGCGGGYSQSSYKAVPDQIKEQLERQKTPQEQAEEEAALDRLNYEKEKERFINQLKERETITGAEGDDELSGAGKGDQGVNPKKDQDRIPQDDSSYFGDLGSYSQGSYKAYNDRVPQEDDTIKGGIGNDTLNGGTYSQGSYIGGGCGSGYSQSAYNTGNNPGNPNAEGYNYNQGAYKPINDRLEPEKEKSYFGDLGVPDKEVTVMNEQGPVVKVTIDYKGRITGVADDQPETPEQLKNGGKLSIPDPATGETVTINYNKNGVPESITKPPSIQKQNYGFQGPTSEEPETVQNVPNPTGEGFIPGNLKKDTQYSKATELDYDKIFKATEGTVDDWNKEDMLDQKIAIESGMLGLALGAEIPEVKPVTPKDVQESGLIDPKNEVGVDIDSDIEKPKDQYTHGAFAKLLDKQIAPDLFTKATVPEKYNIITSYYTNVTERYTPQQAAAIAGNMKVESDLNHLINAGGTEDSAGLVQVNGAKAAGQRKQSQEEYAGVEYGPTEKVNGQEIHTYGPGPMTQVAYVDAELQGLAPRRDPQAEALGDKFKDNPEMSVEEATKEFQNGYERPKDKTGSLDERTKAAKDALDAHEKTNDLDSTFKGNTPNGDREGDADYDTQNEEEKRRNDNDDESSDVEDTLKIEDDDSIPEKVIKTALNNTPIVKAGLGFMSWLENTFGSGDGTGGNQPSEGGGGGAASSSRSEVISVAQTDIKIDTTKTVWSNTVPDLTNAQKARAVQNLVNGNMSRAAEVENFNITENGIQYSVRSIAVSTHGSEYIVAVYTPSTPTTVRPFLEITQNKSRASAEVWIGYIDQDANGVLDLIKINGVRTVITISSQLQSEYEQILNQLASFYMANNS